MGSFLRKYLKNREWCEIKERNNFNQCYLYGENNEPTKNRVSQNKKVLDEQENLFKQLVARFDKCTSELNKFIAIRNISSHDEVDGYLHKKQFEILQDFIISLCKNDKNIMLISHNTIDGVRGLADYAIDAGATDLLNFIVTDMEGANHCNESRNNVAMRVLVSDRVLNQEEIVLNSLGNTSSVQHHNLFGKALGHLAVNMKRFDIVDKCLENEYLSTCLNSEGENIGLMLASQFGKKILLSDQQNEYLAKLFQKATKNDYAVRTRLNNGTGPNMIELAQRNGFMIDDETKALQEKIIAEREEAILSNYKDYLNSGM